MFFPKLKKAAEGLYSVKKFGSLTAEKKVPAGYFTEMENLTSDSYPLMSIRERRGIYTADTPLYFGGKRITAVAHTPMGMLICTDSLVYLDGKALAGARLSPSVKRRSAVLFGRNVFIVPDGVYIRSTDEGLDVSNCSYSMTDILARLSLAREGGEEITPDFAFSFPPSPEAGSTLVLTEDDTMYLYQYSGEDWVKQCPLYVKLFFGFDVSAFGTGMTIDITTDNGLMADGHYTIRRAEEEYILISACLGSTGGSSKVCISKTIPLLDFAVEHNNRLWGCRYGKDENGSFVNQIYASKQGNPQEWYCFDGISTDSYTANLGCAGEFTGAGKLGNEVIFFKESFIIRVLGSSPSEFSVYTQPARGVQSGHHQSLVNLEERLFYKSTDGITVYDGALPSVIAEKQLLRGYTDTVAGAADGKYRIAATSPRGERGIFVFDTKTGQWHREDDLFNTRFMFTRDGSLLSVGENEGSAEYTVFSFRFTENDAPVISGDTEFVPVRESAVSWYAVTGSLGEEDTAFNKKIRCVKLGLNLGDDSFVKISIRPDDAEEYKQIFYLDKKTRGVFNAQVPVAPCQYFSLRLEGCGEITLHSADFIVQYQGEVTDYE